MCLRSGAVASAQALTVAAKSSGIAISMPWWSECADAMAARYPEVAVTTMGEAIAALIEDPAR